MRVFDNQVLSLVVYTNAQPVVYYFKNECSDEDIEEILADIEKYCSEHEISFSKNENSLFED